MYGSPCSNSKSETLKEGQIDKRGRNVRKSIQEQTEKAGRGKQETGYMSSHQE